MGAMAELAGRIPIRHYVDHGGNVQPAAAVDLFLQKIYPDLVAKAKRTSAKAGDVLPLKDVEWRFVTSARETITKPLPGAGPPNPHCAGFMPHTVNPVSGQPLGNTEDEHSLGSHVTFGQFRTLYLADFPWNKEFELDVPEQSPRLRGVPAGLAPRAAQFEFRGARPRPSAACGNHQQRYSQGRAARNDARAAREPGAGRFLAGARGAVERSRVCDSGYVRGEHCRRPSAQPRPTGSRSPLSPTVRFLSRTAGTGSAKHYATPPAR